MTCKFCENPECCDDDCRAYALLTDYTRPTAEDLRRAGREQFSATMTSVRDDITKELDTAKVPRTDTERDGVGYNDELNLRERIRWLAADRDDQAHQLIQARNLIATERARADAAESQLAELHVKLRQTFGVESVSEVFDNTYTAATPYMRFVVTSDDTFDKLSEAQWKAGLLADIIVNPKSGAILKNRFGPTATDLQVKLHLQLHEADAARADAEARAEALEVELAMLEAHIDSLDNLEHALFDDPVSQDGAKP